MGHPLVGEDVPEPEEGPETGAEGTDGAPGAPDEGGDWQDWRVTVPLREQTGGRHYVLPAQEVQVWGLAVGVTEGGALLIDGPGGLIQAFSPLGWLTARRAEQPVEDQVEGSG